MTHNDTFVTVFVMKPLGFCKNFPWLMIILPLNRLGNCCSTGSQPLARNYGSSFMVELLQ